MFSFDTLCCEELCNEEPAGETIHQSRVQNYSLVHSSNTTELSFGAKTTNVAKNIYSPHA